MVGTHGYNPGCAARGLQHHKIPETFFSIFQKGIYGSQFPIQFVQIRSHFADPIEKQKWHMIDPGKIIIN